MTSKSAILDKKRKKSICKKMLYGLNDWKIYGLVMVSTGIMKLEKRVARDASNSTIKIKR